MTLVMFDSIEDNIPADADAIAGYLAGNWPTATEAWFRGHRAAHKVRISIRGDEHLPAGPAETALDFEKGDVESLAELVAWVVEEHRLRRPRPIVYAARDDMESVVIALEHAGVHREQFRVWSAHVVTTGDAPASSAHICGPGTCGQRVYQADGTQWNFMAQGRNLDQSLLDDAFFGPTKTPDPHHYLRFYTGIRVHHRVYNERALVKEYDQNRRLMTRLRHPVKARKRLAQIRPQLLILADRLVDIARHDPKGAHHSYSQFHRGWRQGELRGRAQGKRLA